MVVPGLYGYVSATKWLTEIELTTFDDFDPYWVERGWAAEAPVKTFSRIDTPKPFANLRRGLVPWPGVAWAQHRASPRSRCAWTAAPWRRPELGAEESIDLWRQWVFAWDGADAGTHRLAGAGYRRRRGTQTAERVTPFPDGATGWHQILVTVTYLPTHADRRSRRPTHQKRAPVKFTPRPSRDQEGRA